MRNQGRHITCHRCGQFGCQLTKDSDDRADNRYSCADRDRCESRQRRAKILTKKLCGSPMCWEPAEFNCSCGVQVCKVHAKTRAHLGHLQGEIEGEKH